MVVRALIILFLNLSSPTYAIQEGTRSDLNLLTDHLQQQLTDHPESFNEMTPILLGQPIHYFKESRGDFAAKAIEKLNSIFPGQIVHCPECNTWRMTSKNKITMISSGDIPLQQLRDITRQYQDIKPRSYATIKETPSGVELRIVSLNNGTILYQKLANSDTNLNKERAWNHYALEKRRRIQGDSLHYSFINLGLYPNPIFELEFMEQWGAKNQHISGLSLLLFSPNITSAIGASYHYLLPRNRKINLSAGLFYSLQSTLISSDFNARDSFMIKLQGQYPISNTYGVFASLDTTGIFSIGFAMYNPIFLPFLL